MRADCQIDQCLNIGGHRDIGMQKRRCAAGGTDLGDSFFTTGIVELMFEVALVLLLLHPQSREYERIWFK